MISLIKFNNTTLSIPIKKIWELKKLTFINIKYCDHYGKRIERNRFQ